MRNTVLLTLATLVGWMGIETDSQAQNRPPAKKKSLSKAIVSGIELEESSLTAVVEYLRVKAASANASPENFILYDPKGTIAERAPEISLKLTNIPISDVVKYVCNLSETAFIVDRDAVIIGDKTDLVELKARRKGSPGVPGRNPQILKLSQTRLPEFDFSEVDFATAIDYFRTKANETNQKVPVNFWIKENAERNIGGRLITLKLSNVSLLDAVRYTSELAGCTMRYDSIAMVLGDPETIRDIPKFRPLPGNQMYKRLGNAIITNVELTDAPLADVIEFVKYHTRDQAGFPDGVNIIQQTATEKTVTLKLAKARALDILVYANEATNTTFKIEGIAIVVKDQPPKKKPAAAPAPAPPR